MTVDFDKYFANYIDIINKNMQIAGGDFNYFIKLRLRLMKEKVSLKISKKESMRILDFGCGIGATEVWMRDFFTNAAIIGIDKSTESIKAARKLGLDNVRFIKLESSEFQFGDNYFDLIYSNGTFHHIENSLHTTIFKQLFRVLKDEGDLFIFENNPYNPVMMYMMKSSPIDEGATVVYPRYLRNLLRAAGFRINTTDYYVFYPKGFKFLRISERYLRWLPLGAQYFIWATK